MAIDNVSCGAIARCGFGTIVVDEQAITPVIGIDAETRIFDTMRSRMPLHLARVCAKFST